MGEIRSFLQLADEWEAIERRKKLALIAKYEKEIERLDPMDSEEYERMEQLDIWIKELSAEV